MMRLSAARVGWGSYLVVGRTHPDALLLNVVQVLYGVDLVNLVHLPLPVHLQGAAGVLGYTRPVFVLKQGDALNKLN